MHQVKEEDSDTEPYIQSPSAERPATNVGANQNAKSALTGKQTAVKLDNHKSRLPNQIATNKNRSAQNGK